MKRNKEKKSYILEFCNVSKSFPGVKALDSVSFGVYPGEVLALMGENGAGKSTLMKCLFGVYRRDEGEILLNGEPISFRSPDEALKGGVAMVHQELNQALKLSVKDNIYLGRFPTYAKFLPLVDERCEREKTKEVLSSLGINIDPDTVMEKLSVSERQLIEIAKAVSFDTSVIVFDEPTSSLGENEAKRLFSLIEKLRSEGRAIIYISHKMSEILEIADRVTVMRDGKFIVSEEKKNLSVDKIIKYMVGRKITDRYPKRSSAPSEVFFSARKLSGEYSRLKDASFELRRGEVLGVAGLDGSGRTELIEAIFGVSKRRTGELLLDGVRIKNRNPFEAKRNGFALITEERRRDGIFAVLGVDENMTISTLGEHMSIAGLLSAKKIRSSSLEGIESLKIKTPGPRTRIGTLSGGNQQKVILARWLLTKPKILLLDEPTRGIDVGAKYEIYSIINRLAEGGLGVIMVSSEMSELLGMCDRILVMSAGRLAGEVTKEDASQERIMELATKFL